MQKHLDLAARGKRPCRLNTVFHFFFLFVYWDFSFCLLPGPLRQTFTHNPLLQHDPSHPPKAPNSNNSSIKANAKKPWQDTLGWRVLCSLWQDPCLCRLLHTDLPQPWGLQHLEVFILKVVSTTDSYLCVLKEPWRAKQPSIHRTSKPLSCLGFLMFVKYGRGLCFWTRQGGRWFPLPALAPGKELHVFSWSSQLRPLPHTLCTSIWVCILEVSWARLWQPPLWGWRLILQPWPPTPQHDYFCNFLTKQIYWNP
jgi:hypothetical protein